MKNAMNSVKVPTPSTNLFDKSHDVKFSGNMGYLMPVMVEKCMPGDRWQLSCENMVRMAPMLAPMMQKCTVYAEYFFVPLRILWENFEKWITNGGDEEEVIPTPLPVFPYIRYGSGDPLPDGLQYNKLMDYLGLPDPDQCPNPALVEKVSAAPFAAYQLVWQEFYRDENLQLKVFNGLVDGDNSGDFDFSPLTTIRRRCWEADYFTKALPFAQKGEPVEIPLGVVELREDWWDFGTPNFQMNTGAYTTGTVSQLVGPPSYIGLSGDGNAASEAYDPEGTLIAGSTSVNDWRTAIQLQKWLEINARGGTRYAELVRAHFNVNPQDARLQRPEYIVGVKNYIQISEVLNNTGTDEAPQGSMAGHGISYSEGNYGKYFCQEHGYIICMFSVMPKPSYQQGIPRHWLTIEDPTEFPWPTFANLGEQAVMKKEIMAFRDPGEGEETFGYVPRYMEEKTSFDRVAGDFRDELDFWHMGRIFDPVTPPELNESFVVADPTERVFAVTSPEIEIDHLWCHTRHRCFVRRALPFYGTPSGL